MKAHRLTTQAFLLFVLFFALFLVYMPNQALCQGRISGAPSLYATRKAGPVALRTTRRTAGTGYRRASRAGAPMYAPRSSILQSYMAAFQGWRTRTDRVARGAGRAGYPLTTRARMYRRVSLADRVLGRKRSRLTPFFTSFAAWRGRTALRGGMNWLGGLEGRLFAERKKKYRPMSLYTSRLATGYPFVFGSGMRFREKDYTWMLSLSRSARTRFSGWNNRLRAIFPNL